jgi:hypothetical protein
MDRELLHTHVRVALPGFFRKRPGSSVPTSYRIRLRRRTTQLLTSPKRSPSHSNVLGKWPNNRLLGRLYGLLTFADKEENRGVIKRFPVRRGNEFTFLQVGDVDWIEGLGDYAGSRLSTARQQASF